ncbi:uncharacterized protein LOC111709640 isoform X1 [Eurytemora carolleeae]|uniref:uncharacterized protein LOC111709640 isoform X1 n=1 Tax=Eurytemora carolleeae TaxID=1294199 RepID=UPI000C76F0E8|nr:uncharacterized protein LOC111709640 isoform X1 [Eurytemora carolleeae]|eukprot:XP_023339175.1 uncharacterized protein LOC111709640 isoform X1 [Eurytemora affinis]
MQLSGTYKKNTALSWEDGIKVIREKQESGLMLAYKSFYTAPGHYRNTFPGGESLKISSVDQIKMTPEELRYHQMAVFEFIGTGEVINWKHKRETEQEFKEWVTEKGNNDKISELAVLKRGRVMNRKIGASKKMVQVPLKTGEARKRSNKYQTEGYIKVFNPSLHTDMLTPIFIPPIHTSSSPPANPATISNADTLRYHGSTL